MSFITSIRLAILTPYDLGLMMEQTSCSNFDTALHGPTLLLRGYIYSEDTLEVSEQ